MKPDVDTVVFDRFGVEMGRFHLESNRIPVTLEQMSPILIDAILVAVDPNYLNTEKDCYVAFSGCRPEGKLHSSETFSHSAICEIASWCAQHSNSSAEGNFECVLS